MSTIEHHIPEAMLAAYAAGSLPQAFSLVVAAHISMCDTCRAAVEAHSAVGGALFEGGASEPISLDLKERLLDQLDDAIAPAPVYRRTGIYPAPVADALKGKEPRWKKVGMGVKQAVLSEDGEGAARLLYIPAGQAVPDHGHHGVELTLVLQGSFTDETGHFGIGDVEFADETLDHTPVADNGMPCICLAATDQRLKFNSFIPKLLQPIFRI